MEQRLLTETEVVELTGFKTPNKQAEWLQRERILHFISGQNKVKVTWHSVDHPSYRTEEPDFSQI